MPFGGGSSGVRLPLVLNGASLAGQTLLDILGATVELTLDDGAERLTVSGLGGNTADLVVSDTGDVGQQVLLRSPNLLRITSDTATVQLRDTAGTKNIARLVAGVGLAVGVNAAPADAAVQTGEAAIWFDKTDGVGNTKLMVKAKSADGTVKTAAIVLA